MKIVLFDIETASILGTFWQLRKPYLTHENIVRDSSIICGAWKVYGAGKTTDATWVDPTNPFDDKGVVHSLRDALEDADVLVAHNGDRFDLPWIQSRLVYHKLQPLPPIRTVDTLKVARSKFRFTSNRLDYLGEYLGVGRKIKTDYDLWKQVAKGDARALAKMVRYNRQDVLLLEKVYERLRPYMNNHPNQRLGGDIDKCPTCGTGSLEKRGWRYTKMTAYQRYHCLAPLCGAWSSGESIERTKIA